MEMPRGEMTEAQPPSDIGRAAGIGFEMPRGEMTEARPPSDVGGQVSGASSEMRRRGMSESGATSPGWGGAWAAELPIEAPE
jgi:hypothetical protein